MNTDSSLTDHHQVPSTAESQADPIVLVLAADDNYAMPLAVVARSALDRLSGDSQILIFVIDGGITERNKQQVLRSLDAPNCEVQFIPNPTERFQAIDAILLRLRSVLPPELSHIWSASGATYYRLLIPELLPKRHEKAIYLDGDLVVQTDLQQLWQIDLQSKMIAAAPDLWTPYLSSPGTGFDAYSELNFPEDAKYFNAGVMLIDLKQWRAEEMTNRALEVLEAGGAKISTYGQSAVTALLDQTILNRLLIGRWHELDPRWNLTPAIVDLFASWQDSPFSEAEYQQLIQQPYIVHYATNRKPWNSRHAPFADRFFTAVDQTAWSGWRLTLRRQLQLRVARQWRKYRSTAKTLVATGKGT